MVRLRRITFSFVLVLGAYWIYRLIAVPLVEPEAAARSLVAAEAPASDGKESVRRHEALLAQLYPAGAWQRDDPIVLEGDHVMFVMKEWQNLDNGQVKLNPCTMLFFPSGDPNADATAVRRAVVLEAPQGATLQFDEPFDIRRAKIGKLVGGHMPGTITVHGNSSGPTGRDELFAQTHDVQLTEDRIWTPHPVEFRLGPSYGSGREMQIHLLQGNEGAKSRGPNIAGIESFELLYEVTMHLQPQGGALFPGDRSMPRAPPNATAPPQPPVDIACQGPFRYDFANTVASFRDQVNVIRSGRGPQNDQMTCEKLAIFFAPRTDARSTGNSANSRGAERNLSNLEPRRLEADGLPVVVTAPSSSTYARGQHLEYDIAAGSLLLAAEDEALLHQEANEVRGRKISYVPLAKPKPVEPTDQQAGQRPPQISVVGAAQLRSTEYGQLAAEEIYIWLLDSGPEERLPVARAGAAPSRFLPASLCAKGNVDIRATAISSPADRCIDQLEVWFKQLPPGASVPTGANPVAMSPTPATGTAAPAQAFNSVGQSAARTPNQTAQHFEVAGRKLQMEVLMSGRQTMVDRVTIQGDVFFSEKSVETDERPLVVTGDLLQVFDGASPQTQVVVSGNPGRVDARGLSLVGAKINMHRGQNRLWIDGPGQMTLPVDRDLQGRALSAARPMNVEWKQGMNFDGLTAHFAGPIEARSAGQTMRTETMDVSLVRRIDFNQPPRGERPQVALLVCNSGVFVEGQSVEPDPPAMQRMQMADLSVNQITGEVHASGPGWMRMVRLGRPALEGDGPGAASGLPLVGARSNASPQRKPDSTTPPVQELTYLNVTFQKEITGNLNERQLTFHEQVDTLYGPVKTWEDQLNADRLEGLGPRGVHLKCEALKVIDMAGDPGQRRNIEIEATGNVIAEGMNFNARGGSLRYSEAKDLVTLGDDGRSPATLYRQPVIGGPKDQFAARKIFYWRSTQRVEVDGASNLDLTQLPVAPTAQPAATHTPKKPFK